MYWESYFGPEKEEFHAEAEKRGVEALIATRSFSRDAQSGSILQYAKQGIRSGYATTVLRFVEIAASHSYLSEEQVDV
jgi:predicted glycosyltransferase